MALEKHWEHIAFPRLIEELRKRTRQPLIQGDQPVPQAPPRGANAAEWRAFRGTLPSLYMRYRVTD
jgi:hypothetical protein